MLSIYYGIVFTLLVIAYLVSICAFVSCSDLVWDSHTLLKQCDIVVLPRRGDVIKCDFNSKSTLLMSILKQLPGVPSDDNLHVGVGLEEYRGRMHNKTWILAFDQEQPIGVATVNRTCWDDYMHNGCVLGVQIPTSVWELPALQNHPESNEFWQFSSPIFSSSQNWLRAVKLTSCLIRTSWLSGLQNTSVWTLAIFHGDPGPLDFSLPQLPTLRKLIISHSGLISFNIDNFCAVYQLEELVFSHNVWNGVPHGISHLKRLRLLEVSHSLGDKFLIPTEEMKALKHLEVINFSNNAEITNFTIIQLIPNLQNLKLLNLSNCKINHFGSEDNMFEKFPRLQYLDLSRNHLTELDPNILLGKDLSLLDLSRNYICQWPLLHKTKLFILNLSQNQLTDVSNLGIYGTFVTLLIASLNNISEWQDKDIFTYTGNDKYAINDNPSLFTDNVSVIIDGHHLDCTDCEKTVNVKKKAWVKHVDLSGNTIRAISHEMMESMSALTSVDLEFNPFDCSDCNLPAFLQWIQETHKVNSSHKLVCESPYVEYEHKLTEATSYNELCFPADSTTAILAVGNVLAIIVLVLLFIVISMYWYRFEISYTIHLFKIRNSKHHEQHSKYLYDAFICYSGNDRAWVMRSLVPTLENGLEKYRLCLHDRDFVLGSMIIENIVQSIEKSRRVIIVLSRHFITSKWCQWELDMANHKSFEDSSSFLILIQLETLDRRMLPRHLKFLMDTRTYLEWPKMNQGNNKNEMVFRRLRNALGQSIWQVVNNASQLSIEVAQ